MPTVLKLAQDQSETASDLLSSADVIETMIDLKIQLHQLEQEIQALQPAFFAACLMLNTEKITRQRAIISKRLTPGQWCYSPDILEQESLLKQLKQIFQQDHDPTKGRELSWVIKLLLSATVR
jgi:hypothetical protein